MHAPNIIKSNPYSLDHAKSKIDKERQLILRLFIMYLYIVKHNNGLSLYFDLYNTLDIKQCTCLFVL